jgi:hypothetical protein
VPKAERIKRMESDNSKEFVCGTSALPFLFSWLQTTRFTVETRKFGIAASRNIFMRGICNAHFVYVCL